MPAQRSAWLCGSGRRVNGQKVEKKGNERIFPFCPALVLPPPAFWRSAGLFYFLKSVPVA
ncbi:hypothetical protein P5G61_09035 [Paenibacillus sp. F6_3S_P_1C]|uniref:Uncharacterized protein n=1 Tax=Paenibacillus vandeheii TaxID=3035917 RepID=A0ABT8J8M3_9BACL|nr:hypothetical protein [Paenibacillus vandeheii]